jgi:hypothetical protein
MPQSIPAGLTADHVLRALADLDAGASHPFGEPTKFEVVHNGRRYAPKAVIGLAIRHLAGHVLPPDRFSGGEAPGQANYVLRRLGFTVVRKGEGGPADAGGLAGKDWTAAEVALVVADYFAMLGNGVRGEPYSKTEHRNALRPRLHGRSDPSIEFKHRNLRAVLVRLGLPYIPGYKPAANYQGLLADAVEAFLASHPAYLNQLADAPKLSPAGRPAVPADPTQLFEDPPEDMPLPTHGRPWLTSMVRPMDFAKRDAANRAVGRLGEEFVVEVERARLRGVGRDDLARKVDWVATTVGDGLGYDVRSFDDDSGGERLIEVKTTGQGKYARFYVTATEVRCSEDTADRYHLYRVFDFAAAPKLYALCRSAGTMSPATSTPHIRRSRLTSPWPWPAYRQKPRFTTAPQASEISAPTRASGNPRPGFWLSTWGYSAWLAGVSGMVTVVPSNRYTRRPRHNQPGSALASRARPTAHAAAEKNPSGKRWRARQ